MLVVRMGSYIYAVGGISGLMAGAWIRALGCCDCNSVSPMGGISLNQLHASAYWKWDGSTVNAPGMDEEEGHRKIVTASWSQHSSDAELHGSED